MLTEEQHTAFASLRVIWPEQRIVLIGAGALRAHGKLVRFTADLDVAIAADESEYPGMLTDAPTWKRDAKQHQRWAHENGVEVDIIPAGASLCSQGHVTWPGGHRMSLEGFSALFSSPLAFVDEPLRIEIAPVALIVLLKMVAWLDRPAERTRDLHDLAHLLTEYLDETRDSDFDRIIVAIQHGYVAPYTAQAFLLGQDVASYEGAAPIAHRFVKSLSTTHRWMLTSMQAKGTAALSSDEAFDNIWTSFVKGLAVVSI